MLCLQEETLSLAHPGRHNPMPRVRGNPLIRRHTPNWKRLTQTEEPFFFSVRCLSCLTVVILIFPSSCDVMHEHLCCTECWVSQTQHCP